MRKKCNFCYLFEFYKKEYVKEILLTLKKKTYINYGLLSFVSLHSG